MLKHKAVIPLAEQIEDCPLNMGPEVETPGRHFVALAPLRLRDFAKTQNNERKS